MKCCHLRLVPTLESCALVPRWLGRCTYKLIQVQSHDADTRSHDTRSHHEGSRKLVGDILTFCRQRC